MPRGFRATRIGYDRSQDAPEIARNRRIGLVMAGGIAVAGLGVVTLLYTAPFADPPAASMIEASEAAPIAAAAADISAPKSAPGKQTVQLAGVDKPAAAVRPEPPAEAKPVATASVATGPSTSTDDGWKGIYPKPIPVTTMRIGGSRALTSSYADAPSKRVTSAFGALDPGPKPEAEPRDAVETAAIPPSQMVLPTPRPDYTPPARNNASAKAADDEPPARLPTPTRNVTVNDDVNMRSGPHSGSRVVMVIPDNTTVGLVDCDGWCQVVYNDRSGYIYKSFIGNSGSSRTVSSAAPRKKLTDDPVQRTLTPIGR